MVQQRRPVRGRRRSKVDSTVKTEIRALDVLEFLNHCGGETRVADVVKALDFPQASASRLLNRLSDAGYLTYDRFRRVYCSSPRAALLSGNTMNRIFGRGDPYRMMEEMRRLTSGTVFLTSRNQARLNIIHIERAPDAPEPCVQVGHVSELLGSASGKVMLSRASDISIQGLIRRYNAEMRSGEERVRPAAYLESVGQVRESGYLIHPVEAAVRTIGPHCRCAASGICPTVCCMAWQKAHVVVPVIQSANADVVAAVAIPSELEKRHHADFASGALSVITQYMPQAL